MLARMLGAARLNAHTFEEVDADSGATIQALLVVVLVAIASAIGELRWYQKTRQLAKRESRS